MNISNTTKTAPIIKLAHVISDVFSPIGAPSLAMIVALWLTPLCRLPLGNRLSALFGVIFITAVIPMAFIYTMIRLGKVSDVSISDPRQRTAPYCVAVLCYIGAIIFLASLKAPGWLPLFFGAGAVVSIISLLITKFWKISAHTGGIAGLTALVFWLALKGLLISAPLVWVSLAFLLAGLMAWSRLILNRHTLGQVAAGLALSFSVVLAVLLIFA